METLVGMYYTDTGKYTTRKIHTKLQTGTLVAYFLYSSLASQEIDNNHFPFIAVVCANESVCLYEEIK